MSKRKWVILLVLCAVTALTITLWNMPRLMKVPARTWDFSARHDSSIIPWPLDEKASEFYSLSVSERVVARFPEGHAFDRYVERVDLTKRDRSLRGIAFILEPQKAEDAYKSALKIAQDWQLDTKPLGEWYGRVSAGQNIYGAGPPTVVATRRNDRPVTASLEILHSYQESKPFWIMFQVGWRDN